MKLSHFLMLAFPALVCSSQIYAQALYPPNLPKEDWHGEKRELRYRPVGRDFEIRNGNRRFTRALYGTNTAFRVEAGDLPEFALYMPGMGGNLKFGLIDKNGSKWLISAENIVARYQPGAMHYHIKDAMLGAGGLEMSVLALSKGEGVVLKIRFTGVNKTTRLFWTFGGASGKNFSRSGDMGPDPESVFYLQPQNCKGNVYQLNQGTFSLKYGKDRTLIGNFPLGELQLHDASKLQSPGLLSASIAGEYPVVTGNLNIVNDKDFFLLIQNPLALGATNSMTTAEHFKNAELSRKAIADRIIVTTPDPFINTVGGAIAIASDAIWEDPSYLHGAVGWRMRLNGWRGAYTADALGWHDRARTHFNAYAKSQLLSPASGPVVADTALNLARSKEVMGTAMFSAGYISRDPSGKSLRPHHYDMNLVFIDQLLWHLNWTGDLNYAKEIWPLLTRHLAWEKRNFDSDDDGLYDAYAAIWASDALQYSGGAVTHSTAYNFRANAMAAKIATLIHVDPSPFKNEANKILKALNEQLWMPKKGWFAEYKDALGLKQLHPSAALWTVYHTIDSDVPDRFQAWQALRYVDTELPHIAVRANGLPDDGYYTIATTNWMPYEWSLNNVVLAESTHTALANWQAGRSEEAFKLWKSELLASMYIGGSPGNFVQISHYDANRGEAYRDFGDPVGINSRALVEGLFGIVPDALNKKLMVRPGLPMSWNHAELSTPDLNYAFKRNGNTDTYTISTKFKEPLSLQMIVKSRKNAIKTVKINGRQVTWQNIENAIGNPEIGIKYGAARKFIVELVWGNTEIEKAKVQQSYHIGDGFEFEPTKTKIAKIFDPQNVLENPKIYNGKLKGNLIGEPGNRTVFVQLRDGMFTYWFPVCFDLKLKSSENQEIQLGTGNWQTQTQDQVNLESYFNDRVSQIFNNKYLSPRPKTTTLQLPVQGIGDWPHPNVKPEINDSGLRELAGIDSRIKLPSGIVFATPSEKANKNILFTSQWDNYPDSAVVPLTGKAKAAFFLLAGSTNPMQSRMNNGRVTITYTDGTVENLMLRNPENWWPIEKNLFLDGAAFDTKAPIPLRIHLKTGKIITEANAAAWNGKEIDGGAATALGLALNPNKTLAKITLHALCNDVVIGLMAITLQR